MLPAGVAPSGSPNETEKRRRRSVRQDRREEAMYEAVRAWIGRFRELGSSPSDEEAGDFLRSMSVTSLGYRRSRPMP